MSRPLLGVRLLIAMLAACSVAAVSGEHSSCERVVAVGDLHGGYQPFVQILTETGLVDAELNWLDERACLVQLGDLVDRGPRSRELLDLMIELTGREPGRVFSLLGNHEAMNIIGDLRYVDPAEFAAFAGEETVKERERAFRDYARDLLPADLSDDERRRRFDERYPPGWFAHRRAFGPDGRYGRWLLSRPTAMKIDRTLFVHGGLVASDAESGLESLNREIVRSASRFLELRARLEQRGVIPPAQRFVELLDTLQVWLERERKKPELSQDSKGAWLALELLGLADSALLRLDGPLWDRELAMADEQSYAPQLEKTLHAAGVSRVVVGHTPTASSRIEPRFADRVFVIDTGAGPYYRGRISALEIVRRGAIRAIYLDGSELLVTAPRDERRIEAALSGARVLESHELGSGITRPKKLLLEWEGQTFSAAFKDIDVQNMDVTRFSDSAEFNFTDNYRYERAAYRLDRLLGLNMVPVVVLREIDGTEGAVVEWVPDAINETERRAGTDGPDDPLRLVHQREVMLVFDALIRNTDRNPGNQLYTADWTLHLIDHSRSFRVQRQLPEGFVDVPIGIPRSLLERLRALEARSLGVLMKGLLSKLQIRALLARRDAIVKKFDADRKQHGDAFVFHDFEPQPAAAVKARP